MSKKNNYYVVWQGKQPGIYSSWEQCKSNVIGVEGAKYKGFSTELEALEAYGKSFSDYYQYSTRATQKKKADTHPELPALAVDAACSGNPGQMEFRGVIADTGTEVFHRGPYPGGTNNIGEFLAIILGLAYLKQNKLSWALYSDSRTGIAWVKNKRAKTQLNPTSTNAPLFDMIRDGEKWLQQNTWTTKILKWDTNSWGEIPADFGRK